jgi:hypothetical protein
MFCLKIFINYIIYYIINKCFFECDSLDFEVFDVFDKSNNLEPKGSYFYPLILYKYLKSLFLEIYKYK